MLVNKSVVLRYKDVMSIILMKLNDIDLYNFRQINKRANFICDEHFWRNRLWERYGKFYPEENQTWKEMYLKLVYYIDKYGYEKDNTKLNVTKITKKLNLIRSLSCNGHIINNNNHIFSFACHYGHLEIVKYFISLPKEYKIKPRVKKNISIGFACMYGHLDVVKYLMSLPKEYNIDPIEDDNWAIRVACEKGHLEVVKYLMSLPKKYGIEPCDRDNQGITWASKNGHLEVVEYLLSLPKEYEVHL